MGAMITSTLLFALFALALGAAAYVAGRWAGERAGRRQTHSDLKDIARAAAAESNQQAREAYDHATEQAVKHLEAAVRSDREIGQEQFAKTATPLKESLADVRRLARELQTDRARDQGALQDFTKRLSAQMDGVVGSSDALRQALKGDRQARGRWGEIQLENLIESVGLAPHCDFQTQTGWNGSRPDLVLRLPNGSFLPVDSKVPLDDYLAAAEVSSPDEQEAFFGKHAKAVKSHADTLGKRDYPAKLGDGPPFTVMFLPIESLLAEAIRHEPDLLQFAADRKVVLATPHTLLGLLWSVAAMWRNETSTRNAEEMKKAGLELEKRLEIFLGHFADVGSQLARTNAVYNAAAGSAESRLTPHLRKLRELGGQPEETTEDRLPKPVEVAPRRLFGDDVDVVAERELL